MATTVPDGIWTPDDSTAYNLPVDLAAMADTVQAGLNAVRSERSGFNQQFYGPAASMAGVTGMKRGDTYQESDGSFIIWRYDGTAWQKWASSWITWSPTLAAGAGTFTVGNGTLTARYRWVQGQVNFTFRLLFGSTTSIGTSNPNFTLPVNLEVGHSAFATVASGTLGVTNGSAVSQGIAYRSGTSANVVIIGTWNVSSTYPAIAGAGATTPFGWGAGCYIELSGTYQPV